MLVMVNVSSEVMWLLNSAFYVSNVLLLAHSVASVRAMMDVRLLYSGG